MDNTQWAIYVRLVWLRLDPTAASIQKEVKQSGEDSAKAPEITDLCSVQVYLKQNDCREANRAVQGTAS